ncbi:MAG: thiamine phosphate synthase [Candidatus Omnitrophota bacterium]|nr:thiamine phosphate synthase [Candidatus Omnitrophota bacterium]
MKLRKSLLKKSQLYLILDRPGFSRFSLKKIISLVSGKEIGLIQLRDKSSAKADVLKFAIKLAKLLGLTKTLFIVNDYVDVAVACGADGVHLGQDDLSLKQARKILGKDKIIGLSCHNLRQALKAQKEGADYIGIGPIYATATKPGCPGIGLKAATELKAKIKIPYFAIGNIGEGNIKGITAAGIRRIAVCRAILEADDPKGAAKRLYKRLRKL